LSIPPCPVLLSSLHPPPPHSPLFPYTTLFRSHCPPSQTSKTSRHLLPGTGDDGSRCHLRVSQGSVCRYARHAREPARWHPGGCHVLHHLGDGERCSLVGSELDEHRCQLWDLRQLRRRGGEPDEQCQHRPCCALPELMQPHRERMHDGLGHRTPAALPSTRSTRASSAS